jgi:hypothetical protein
MVLEKHIGAGDFLWLRWSWSFRIPNVDLPEVMAYDVGAKSLDSSRLETSSP